MGTSSSSTSRWAWWSTPHRGIPTARWSTRCCITAKSPCPASTGSCAPALSTALTGTPPACSSRPRTTGPIWPWRRSFRITPCSACTMRWCWEASGRIPARWTPPLPATPTDRKRMAVCRPGEGREAITHYQVVDSHDGYTHLTCRLETGRTHQIRVHMAHIGHPLLGDPVYGPQRPFPRPGGPVPPRRPAHLHPPGHRGTADGGGPSARLVSERAGPAASAIKPALRTGFPVRSFCINQPLPRQTDSIPAGAARERSFLS